MPMRISGKVLDRVLCLTGPNADDVTATRWRCWEVVALAAAVAQDDPAEEAVEWCVEKVLLLLFP